MTSSSSRRSSRRTDTSRAHRAAARAARRRTMVVGGIAVTILLAVVVGAVVVGARSLGGSSSAGEPAASPGASTGATASAESSATTASAPSEAEQAAAEEPPVIEIGWVGDLTPGSKYGQPPDNGRALFADTKNLLREPDLMIANLEGTFGEGGPSKCDGRDSSACYAFQAPPANAASLAWAGIDVVSLANNHANDYFGAGLDTTKRELKANKVAYTGMPEQVTVRTVKGVDVAVVGFSPYAWNASIADIAGAKDLVQRAAEQADVVVVVMHAGAEGADKTHVPDGAEYAYGEFRGETRAFARAVVDAGADLVFGSGPHVVRGIERYEDRLIAYSLGNFAGWKNFNRSGDLALSGLLTVRVTPEGEIVDGLWRSLRIEAPGVPHVDDDHDSAALVRRLSADDFDATFELDEDGSFSGE